MSRRPVIANRQLAIYCGYGAFLLGSFLLWDAYEHRGRSKPFAAKFLPGV